MVTKWLPVPSFPLRVLMKLASTSVPPFCNSWNKNEQRQLQNPNTNSRRNYLFTKANNVNIDFLLLEFASQLVQFLFVKVHGRADKNNNPSPVIFPLTMLESQL